MIKWGEIGYSSPAPLSPLSRYIYPRDNLELYLESRIVDADDSHSVAYRRNPGRHALKTFYFDRRVR